MTRPEFAPITFDRLSSPEYERHCAALLHRLGWTVQVTRAGRGHDADMIAEKHGARLVLRCVRHFRPVGCRPLQEVHAARHLYDAAIACVVAPSGFTAQARREAGRLSVRLLHHSELEALDRQLG